MNPSAPLALVVQSVSRVLLAILFGLSALLKLTTGYEERLLLSAWLYHTMTAVDIVIAAGLLSTRGYRLAASGALFVAMAGLALELMTDRPCGCLGTNLDRPALHIAFSSLIGLCACVILLRAGASSASASSAHVH